VVMALAVPVAVALAVSVSLSVPVPVTLSLSQSQSLSVSVSLSLSLSLHASHPAFRCHRQARIGQSLDFENTLNCTLSNNKTAIDRHHGCNLTAHRNSGMVGP